MNGSLLAKVADRLMPLSDSPALDASVLLAHIVGRPRTWIMAHPDISLSAGQRSDLEAALVDLQGGASFPYVLGHWEFFGLDLLVTPDVIIPRPETELLVEKAISWLQGAPGRRTIADVGTGSGCIAIALAVNVPDARVLATDISPAALAVARQNARRLDVEELIEFAHCDLLPKAGDLSAGSGRRGSLPHRLSPCDLICANLPYIPTGSLKGLPIYGREPTIGLDGGQDGLLVVRRLLGSARKWLAPRGKMLLEIESTRGVKALALAYDAFSETEIRLHRDLAGRDRLLEIQLKS